MKKSKDWLVELNDRVRGSLIGGAAGDALGYAIEFQDENYIFEKYGPSGITEFELIDGKALISDDTQMTLFTAAGLLTGNSVAMKRGFFKTMEPFIYLSYLDWLHTQAPEDYPEHPGLTWLADERGLYDRRAPGNTCLSALFSGEMGGIGSRINNSKGCGGVMRVAPVGLLMGTTDTNYKMVDELGAGAAAITHGHDLGFIPGAMLADLTGRLSRSDISMREAVDAAMVNMTELFGDMEHIREFVELMEKAIGLSQEDIGDLDAIHKLGQGWTGDEALAIAVYCSLKYPEDIEKALIAAVNHEGDSDSTGAITGNIVGAHVGFSRIPEKFIKDLELKDLILEIADDLSLGVDKLTLGGKQSKKWTQKYLRWPMELFDLF